MDVSLYFSLLRHALISPSNLGSVFSPSGLAHGQVDDSTMWRADGTGYEYYISTLLEETMMSWHVARGLCMQNGGDLTSIHSDTEKNFITQYVSHPTSCYSSDHC